MDKSKFTLEHMEHPNFPLEAHEVITKDGYILTLLRVNTAGVTNNKDSSLSPTRDNCCGPPVLFVHGFICSSEQWIVNAEGALPYRMARDGYDCWIANLRGTPLSSRHTTIAKNSKKYWNFSFHEIGKYDIPAMIDYILELTGYSNILYFGHSMGCTVLLLAVEQVPETKDKIELMIAFAPAVYGSHITNMYFKFLIPVINVASKSKYFRTRQLFGRTCKEYSKLLFLGSRSDNAQKKSEKMGAWLYHHFGRQLGITSKADKVTDSRESKVANTFPRATSLKLFCHGLQTWHSGKPVQFNYGRSVNMEVYGTPKPPEYNFESVKIPVVIFYSDADELCPSKDVEKLASVLPNVLELLTVDFPEFSHLDFLVSKKANEAVYNPVYQLLNKMKFKYNPTSLGIEQTSL